MHVTHTFTSFTFEIGQCQVCSGCSEQLGCPQIVQCQASTMFDHVEHLYMETDQEFSGFDLDCFAVSG